MPDAAIITGNGESTTLILRAGLVRESVTHILADVLEAAVIPAQQERLEAS